ncbi:MAG: hypothetical protein GTO60_16700 [Gammaproteobacteria bacterium]|nr:hypothetical protein [Gammaproteobacteria bacterium]
MAKTQAESYPVRKGSRYDRIAEMLIYNRVVSALLDRAGDEDASAYRLRDDFYFVGLEEADSVYKFSRFLSYTDRRQNGKCVLSNIDGTEAHTPSAECQGDELLAAYEHWLKCDESITNRIDERIRALNAPPTPAHMVPADELTEEQKADPNS